jgi:hypothetical protein
MRFTTRCLSTLLVLGLGAGGAKAVGTVQVSYLHPDQFADIGQTRYDIDANLRSLTRVFESLAARYLADGQRLSVEVLDVDLAGEPRPARHGAYEVRVLRGTVDWPRIRLRYTLETAGQPSRSGERQLQDMAYLDRLGSSAGTENLVYEYRLLRDWFSTEFGHARAAGLN